MSFRTLAYALLLAALLAVFPSRVPPMADDPYLFLEDIHGDRALSWVRSQNANTTAELEADPRFAAIRQRLLQILESDDRIPVVAKHGGYLYNFWTDSTRVRGLWRRTTLAEYRKPEPDWEPVLDLDALAHAEGENWVWQGATFLYPGEERCLLRLSRGGADAATVREFDVQQKQFVSGGFQLPEAKTWLSWHSRDHLYVGTDLGPESLTEAGYPRQVRLWRRGTPLAESQVIYESQASDIGAAASVVHEPGYRRELVTRVIAWNRTRRWLVRDGELVRLDLPEDADLSFFKDLLLLQLRSDLQVGVTVHPAGSLLTIPMEAFLKGDRRFEALYVPTPRSSLSSHSRTAHHLILNELDHVRGRVHVLTRTETGWQRSTLPAPRFGEVEAHAVDPYGSDDYFMTVTDFLTPTGLYLGSLGTPDRERLKQSPAFFAAEGLHIEQHEAVSADGTHVPYFQVAPNNLTYDGSHPTLLYGYGGFEIPMTPGYSGTVGAAWLERGGVYVLANIRGGSEFGPAWHKAALRDQRQRAFDDFIAIAEDLIARGVTSPPHLGIMGGSNGGLLMGVMLTQRPELFSAVACQVPLLDMRRYHKLLAGASWVGEYGDPDDPDDWAFIRKYSPYHNLTPDRHYPRVLFTTSTRDDRVHPGHARKMAARMLAQGHDVLYYENIEGGHGGAANSRQLAYMAALRFTFLLRQLR